MKTERETAHAEEIKVGTGEIKISNNYRAVLTTPPLGSGVAVTVYDPVVKIGGILHFLLPKWEISKNAALENPSIFANSGIPQLFRRCYKFGAKKERIVTHLIGGADVMDKSESFQPGSENYKTALDILTRNEASVQEVWVGGAETRSVRLHVADGRVEVLSNKDKVANA